MARNFEAEEEESDSTEISWVERLPLTEFEERLSFWRLCDELSVLQAAALIVGVDPSDTTGAHCDNWRVDQQPKGFAAAKAALVHAINGGRLAATIRHSAREYGWADHRADIEAGEADGMTVTGSTLEDDERLSGNHSFAYRISPDWSLTTIQVDDLRQWLMARGFNVGFFFPNDTASPDYLSPRHQRYAPKLAAAVNAWLAVTDPGSKSPKRALDKWLRENAARYGLTDEDGNPINTAIEECSKVANWQPGGGVPKTPAG